MTDQWTVDESRYEGARTNDWPYYDDEFPDERLMTDAPLLLAECVRLRAIVDRLPKTADGVPVVPDLGDDSTYWRISPKGEVLAFEVGIDLSVGCGHGCCSDWISFNDLYSTKEAAEAARKGDSYG